MTIEIKQLVIRAVAEARPPTPSSTPAPRHVGAPPQAGAAPGAVAELDREALVAECVREVLRELRKSRER